MWQPRFLLNALKTDEESIIPMVVVFGKQWRVAHSLFVHADHSLSGTVQVPLDGRSNG